MAKFCTECGAALRDGIAFCTQCGAKAEPDAPAPQTAPAPRPAPQRTAPPPPQYAPAPDPKEAPVREKAVSTGAFFGLMFLFSLPVLGWLACLIMAFAPKNLNIKHFARAMLIWLVIALVIGTIAGFAVNALVRSVTPYIEQAMGELGSIGELREAFGQLGSLTEFIDEIENMIPETLPVE